MDKTSEGQTILGCPTAARLAPRNEAHLSSRVVRVFFVIHELALDGAAIALLQQVRRVPARVVCVGSVYPHVRPEN